MKVDEDAVAAIAAEIRSYLAAHPEAADSVAGIHRWWLPPKFSAEHSSAVEQALDRLVLASLVRVRYLPDGATVYGGIERDPLAPRRCD
jgi:hypothetical protein